MLVFDTNVLVHAAMVESPFHELGVHVLQEANSSPEQRLIPWNVGYEFLRVATLPAYHPAPLETGEAWRFLSALLQSPGFGILRPTANHAAVLTQALTELPGIRGNLFFDLYTAVQMRENGLTRICTFDRDFDRFPFLSVINPLR